MSNDILNLTLPLTEKDARALELGRIVAVSGRLFTGRSRFHIRAVEEGIFPPIDYQAVNAFFHTGPVMAHAEQGWRPISAEPTSSIRFERYGPEVVRRFGLRTLIGKTTMGAGTVAALRETGGVYLSKIGLCGNQLASQVKHVVNVFFLDELGKTEATWVFEVEDFGPFFVAIDAHGNSYFENLRQETVCRMPAIERTLDIPPDFELTDVNSSRDRRQQTP